MKLPLHTAETPCHAPLLMPEQLQDLWDAMEGEEGLTLTDGAKGYLAAVYVSHLVWNPDLKPCP